MEVETIDLFLNEFREFVSGNKALNTKLMSTFLSDFRSCLKSQPPKTRFNILEITQVGNNEVKHSSILAWLLNPDASHACGTVFLGRFLNAANIQIPEDDLSGCQVRTEFSGTESIIDILVYKNGKFLIYIENKTISGEAENQVTREYNDMQRVGKSIRVPKDKRFPVFLTPGGRVPVSGDSAPWHLVSYNQLAREFLTVLPILNDQKVSYLLEDLIGHYKLMDEI